MRALQQRALAPIARHADRRRGFRVRVAGSCCAPGSMRKVAAVVIIMSPIRLAGGLLSCSPCSHDWECESVV